MSKCFASVTSNLFRLAFSPPALRAPRIPIQQLNPIIVRTDACSWIIQNQHLHFPSSPCLPQKLTISYKASSETLHMWFSALFVWFLVCCDHLIGQTDKSRLSRLYLASMPDKYETPIAVLFKHLVECPTVCMLDTVPTSLHWPVWNEVPCGPMRPYTPYQGFYHPASTLTGSVTLQENCANSEGLCRLNKPVIHNHIQTIIAFTWNLNMLNFSAAFCNTRLHSRWSNLVGIWL